MIDWYRNVNDASLVHAVQFDPHKHPWPDGIVSWHSMPYQPRDMSWGYIQIGDGKKHVMSGDWIVVDEAGNKHVCPDSVFTSTYTLVQVLPVPLTEERVREIFREEIGKWERKQLMGIRWRVGGMVL